MIIIIPIGGVGARFSANGYTEPKALITVCNKPIIYYLIDNLNISNIEYVYIPYAKEYAKHDFENKLTNQYPHIAFRFYCIDHDTRGAAETIHIAILNLNEPRDIPVICIDCDNFYLCDIISTWNGSNCVFTVKDTCTSAIYSYIECTDLNQITNIAEKDKISDYACTGAYGFNSIHDLQTYASTIIEGNKMQKNEFYTSGVIKEMIYDGHFFTNIVIQNKHYFSLGTPEQVYEYTHPFIFDLDGTLVDTDKIYRLVWNEIMTKYNLHIDDNFFHFFIQGKNDISVLMELFPNITQDAIDSIRQLKDTLFIQYLHNFDDIMICGAVDFIKRNKNRRMGVVTNCNRRSAEFILAHTKLDEYMIFLITSDDCKHPKPNKEPYQRAIDILQCDKCDCTIFEDSNSGYKSAKSLGGTNICLIVTNKSDNTILNAPEYKITTYHNFDNHIYNIAETDVCEYIMQALSTLPIKKVTINNKDIKVGYICDIKSFTLHLNNSIENVVFKIENYDNELSNVAREINLYSNEMYFYEKISGTINIPVPKLYSTLNINNIHGILLENLTIYDGEFNLDLNRNVDLILSVVKNVVEMHNHYYFKNEEEIIPIMKSIRKINETSYYEKLIRARFPVFIEMNMCLLAPNDIHILTLIHNNYKIFIDKLCDFPVNFCHGDLKSPNIYYRKDSGNTITPIFLDWQYINLSKGISDIAFLLVESTDYSEILCDVIIKYYYTKSNMYDNFNDLMLDFKISLCVFPFFVMVWFNSENRDNLLDTVFPIRFMKNLLKFYNKYLDDMFFDEFSA
jgi:beta-phosphoglucomutase-like phosphatase (HAD superfamily)/choline kinase